jgi:hypothetical protein
MYGYGWTYLWLLLCVCLRPSEFTNIVAEPKDRFSLGQLQIFAPFHLPTLFSVLPSSLPKNDINEAINGHL